MLSFPISNGMARGVSLCPTRRVVVGRLVGKCWEIEELLPPIWLSGDLCRIGLSLAEACRPLLVLPLILPAGQGGVAAAKTREACVIGFVETERLGAGRT